MPLKKSAGLVNWRCPVCNDVHSVETIVYGEEVDLRERSILCAACWDTTIIGGKS